MQKHYKMRVITGTEIDGKGRSRWWTLECGHLAVRHYEMIHGRKAMYNPYGGKARCYKCCEEINQKLGLV